MRRWGGETVGFRWAASISSKTSTRLHVPESEEQRPRASKLQKTTYYESKALVKNWELSIQRRADHIRPKRAEGNRPPWHYKQNSLEPSFTWLLTTKFNLKHSKLSGQTRRLWCLAQLQHRLPQERASGSYNYTQNLHFIYSQSSKPRDRVEKDEGALHLSLICFVQNTAHNPRRGTEMRF